MAPSLLPFDDLDGSKFKVILFDVKYLKNGNSYHVGPIGFTLDDLESHKRGGNGDRHVGIYASRVNWRNCLFVCLSAGFW